MSKKREVSKGTATNIKPANVESSGQAVSMKPVKEVADFFAQLGKKAIWVALALVFIIFCIVFKDFLLQQKAFMFRDMSSDSYLFSYPVLYNYADQISRVGIPKWSFRMGMGQNTFPFVLRDPFDILLYFTGKKSIPGLLIYIEMIKVMLTGFVFFKYLKLLKLSDYVAIIGTLFYCFSGFIIEGSAWYVFTYEAFNLALILFAFEMMLQRGKWLLFPLSIFLVAISMPFNLYVFSVFLLFYASVRSMQSEGFNGKALMTTYVRMIALGAIGVLLAGPFLLENVAQLLESPRGSGANSLASKLMAGSLFELPSKEMLGTSIMRFFSNDILGSGYEFHGWKNILEAPMFYCGLPCLLLMPQIFKFLDKPAKIAYFIFVGVWLLPIVFPYLRHAFWLFSGDYFRIYSLFVSSIFIVFSLSALDEIIKKSRINLVTLGVTLVLLLILVSIPYFDDPEAVNGRIHGMVVSLLIAYSVLLYFMVNGGNAVFFRYIFLGFFIAECLFFASTTTHDRDAVLLSEMTDKIDYNDNTIEAVNYIKERDKSFFRIDKSYFSVQSKLSSLNDAMVQEYNGTMSYNSFNQLYYTFYCQEVGLENKDDEKDTRWAQGSAKQPLVGTLNSVKYILAKRSRQPLWRSLCDSLTTFGNVTIFKNKYALPLGYAYKLYMFNVDFNKLGRLGKELTSTMACATDDRDRSAFADLKRVGLGDTLTNFNFDTIAHNLLVLREDTLAISTFTDTHIAGKIASSANELLYLSIPYDKGWTMKIDGKEQKKIILFGGMTGAYLTKGDHTIEMNYELRYLSKGLLMALAGLICYLILFGISIRKRNTSNVL